jgi:hypothetical protein
MDVLMETYKKSEIELMISSNKIEISPLAYMRGRTFKSSLIIADEMQNSSPSQMLMLTTRIGSKSKLIITGDLVQTDKKEGKNGLSDLINKIRSYSNELNKSGEGKRSSSLNCIEIIELTKEDIERSEIVEKIIEIYDYCPLLKKVIPKGGAEKQNPPETRFGEAEKENAIDLSLVKQDTIPLVKEIENSYKTEDKNETTIFHPPVDKKGDADAALMPLKDMSRYFIK